MAGAGENIPGRFVRPSVYPIWSHQEGLLVCDGVSLPGEKQVCYVSQCTRRETGQLCQSLCQGRNRSVMSVSVPGEKQVSYVSQSARRETGQLCQSVYQERNRSAMSVSVQGEKQVSYVSQCTRGETGQVSYVSQCTRGETGQVSYVSQCTRRETGQLCQSVYQERNRSAMSVSVPGEKHVSYVRVIELFG